MSDALTVSAEKTEDGTELIELCDTIKVDTSTTPTKEAEDATKLIELCDSIKRRFGVNCSHPAYPLFERIYRMWENATYLEPHSENVWTVFYKEGTKHLAGIVRVASYINSITIKAKRLNIEFNERLHGEIVNKLIIPSKPARSVKKWTEYIKSTVAAYQTGEGEQLLASFQNPYEAVYEMKNLRTPFLFLERKVHVVSMLVKAFEKVLNENKGDKDDITDYVETLINNARISKDAAEKKIEKLMNADGRITVSKLEDTVELICGAYNDIENAIKLYSIKGA